MIYPTADARILSLLRGDVGGWWRGGGVGVMVEAESGMYRKGPSNPQGEVSNLYAGHEMKRAHASEVSDYKKQASQC